MSIIGAASMLAFACGGVPNDSVTKEANSILENAELARVLHARCVDAGAAADPAVVSALCEAETQKLSDIELNASALLRAAGADAGPRGAP